MASHTDSADGPTVAPRHPSVERVLSGLRLVEGGLSRSELLAWASARGPQLDAAVETALGDRLRIVELFAGIGGLGSGLERGLDAVTVMQAEGVAERRRLLRRRFPLSLVLDDVTALLDRPPPADPERLVVAGGFPCRGASRANLTGPRGMAHPRTGLWSVMAEVVRRWKPRLVVIENVVGLRSRGLDVVLRDLDGAGYDVLWGTLKASDFGAPHERARLFAVASRRGGAQVEVKPRVPLAAWTPWSGPIPASVTGDPGQQLRVRALGDAVVPIVAWSVGEAAARVLGGWWPEGGRAWTGAGLPSQGVLDGNVMRELAVTPFEALPPQRRRRFVVVDARFEAGGPEHLAALTAPPVVGRVYYENGDMLDVELPGGVIEPFPVEWARDLWPTPTASDGRNRGGWAQWLRRSPGINALAQAESCPREEWAQGAALLEMFSGRGVGPELVEWMMGFQAGWTAAMVDGGRRAEAGVQKGLGVGAA